MIFSNIAKVSLNVVSKRFIRKKVNLKSWPNDWVPFHWSRPEKVPGYFESGDLVEDLEPATPDKLHPDFRHSEELKRLDIKDPLRKVFSVQHCNNYEYRKTLVHDLTKQLGLVHNVDHANSLEAKIINLTFALKNFQSRVKLTNENLRFNGHIRMAANSVKYRRNRYLNELNELHGDRYKRIIEELQIEPKPNLINVPFYPVYRKVQMRKLAIEYARGLKESKVEEFVKSLKKDQKEFEQEKKETLEWIKEQEMKLSTEAFYS